MIYLHKHSSKILTYSVTSVPAGTALANAYWALKNSPYDDDWDALVLLEVSTTDSDDGAITDSGSGDAAGIVEFYVPPNAVSELDFERTYFAAAKVKLDNDEVYVLPDSIESVRIRPQSVSQE